MEVPAASRSSCRRAPRTPGLARNSAVGPRQLTFEDYLARTASAAVAKLVRQRFGAETQRLSVFRSRLAALQQLAITITEPALRDVAAGKFAQAAGVIVWQDKKGRWSHKHLAVLAQNLRELIAAHAGWVGPISVAFQNRVQTAELPPAIRAAVEKGAREAFLALGLREWCETPGTTAPWKPCGGCAFPVRSPVCRRLAAG